MAPHTLDGGQVVEWVWSSDDCGVTLAVDGAVVTIPVVLTPEDERGEMRGWARMGEP